jgi:hypothetical protein
MGAPLKSILLEWGFLFARASARVEGSLTQKASLNRPKALKLGAEGVH